VPLSYYSPAVGGLPGATALGMEPTYYWDALTDDALDWLRTHTGPGQKVRFATFPTSWLYLRQTGRLPAGLLPSDPGAWAWYVVQNRPGAFSTLDRTLAARGKAAYTVTKLGVPLLWVFPFVEVETLLRPAPTGRLDTDQRRTPTEPPARSGRAVGVDEARAVSDDRVSSLAGGLNLARGVDLGRGGRGPRRAGDRGRGAGLLVVEQATQLDLVAAEEAALLLRGLADRRRRARLADRGRGAGNHGRTGGGTLLLVTRLGVGRQEGAEEARKGQGQKVTSHGVLSSSVVDSDLKTHRLRHLASLGNLCALLEE
jgi:hypothetical protein